MNGRADLGESGRFAAIRPINQSLKHHHPDSFMWECKFPLLFWPLLLGFLYYLLVTGRFLIGTLTQRRLARYCEPNRRRLFPVSITLEMKLEQWYSRILRILRRCLGSHGWYRRKRQDSVLHSSDLYFLSKKLYLHIYLVYIGSTLYVVWGEDAVF